MSGPVTTPTVDVLEALGEEWNALGLVSYHGTSWGSFAADLGSDDVEQIRALIQRAASEIERLRTLIDGAVERATWTYAPVGDGLVMLRRYLQEGLTRV